MSLMLGSCLDMWTRFVAISHHASHRTWLSGHYPQDGRRSGNACLRAAGRRVWSSRVLFICHCHSTSYSIYHDTSIVEPREEHDCHHVRGAEHRHVRGRGRPLVLAGVAVLLACRTYPPTPSIARPPCGADATGAITQQLDRLAEYLAGHCVC